jgi:hypothetical protein
MWHGSVLMALHEAIEIAEVVAIVVEETAHTRTREVGDRLWATTEIVVLTAHLRHMDLALEVTMTILATAAIAVHQVAIVAGVDHDRRHLVTTTEVRLVAMTTGMMIIVAEVRVATTFVGQVAWLVCVVGIVPRREAFAIQVAVVRIATSIAVIVGIVLECL